MFNLLTNRRLGCFAQRGGESTNFCWASHSEPGVGWDGCQGARRDATGTRRCMVIQKAPDNGHDIYRNTQGARYP